METVAFEPRPLAGCRVLVADDAESIRQLFVAALARIGAEVLPAADGSSALAAFETCRRSARRIDVAMIDYELPDMKGPDVAAALREAGFQTAIVGYSARAGLAGTPDRFLEAGGDAVIDAVDDLREVTSTVAWVCGRGWLLKPGETK